MDNAGKEFRVAQWTDEKGENVVGGFVIDYARDGLRMHSLKYGDVVVPFFAELFKPSRPVMTFDRLAGEW